MTTYVTGDIRRGRRWGWADHIGEVDHRYGASNGIAWVRTLCGLTGAMTWNERGVRLDALGLCGSCRRVWDARNKEKT